ncbi:MAG TPA: NUDIX hydrolase, partial [Micromonosporaceae bacterium]
MNSLTFAVAAVVTDDAGRVLLCQQRQGRRRWGLPGGRVRTGESPIRAAVRDIREETGMETDIEELVGIYHLTGGGPGDALPDVLVHVFRARVQEAEATLNSPGRICRLSWHSAGDLPHPTTPTTRAAIDDALSGRAGVLRLVHRDAEPEIPEAAEAEQRTAEQVLAAG